jgi:dipeptidyl aminopeptidase/acylaminoacyl peptidase
MTTKPTNETRPLSRDDLYNLKLVGDAQISPDGTRVAYVVKALDREKDEYVGNIHVWHDGQSRQFTAGGKDASPRWSPDGTQLAFLSGRAEKTQLFIIPASGGEAVQMTTLDMGAGEPVWSPDSTRIAFAASVEYPKRSDEEKKRDEKRAPTKVIDRAVFKFDGAGFTFNRRAHIFRLDVETKEVTQLTDGDFNDRTPAWTPDGRQIAYSANRKPDWDTQRGSDIWIIAADCGEPRQMTTDPGAWFAPAFSPDGSSVAYLGWPLVEGEEPDYWNQVWVSDRAMKKTVNVLAETDFSEGHSVGSDWAARGADASLIWASSGLHFLVSARASSNVRRWTGRKLEESTKGEHDVSSFSVSSDGVVAYVSSDETHPAEVFMAAKSKPRQLSFVNRELLDQLQLRSPDHIVVSRGDGEEIEGWVLPPAGLAVGQKYPVLLYIHGGPATCYGHTFFHELQWWSGQGYGVAYCNPRGGSSYGRDFQNAIRHNWGSKDYHDIMAFTDEVVKRPWVDSSRLATAGGSYGGYMVNWLAGHTDRFAAICTQRSICNMVSQGGTSDFSAFRQDRSGGTPEGNPQKLWDQSPLKFASKVKTPTLILHQENDHRCPIEQGEQWFSALKRLRVPVRFIRFPEESHGMSRTGKPSRRHDRLGYMRDWFAKYV